jgi:hypothetical protein
VIVRTRDPELVNGLADGDFTEFLAEPLHVCLVDGDGGALFAFRGPGIYEVHVFFTARGRAALDFGHELLAVMRRDHGARMFWSMIPQESRKVRMFARLMGWKSLGLRETSGAPNELFVSEICPCLQS